MTLNDNQAVTSHNLEFKCRIPNRPAAERALRDWGATFVCAVAQRDTYLHSGTHARMKVREQDGAAELITYRRDESGADRVSRYTVAPLDDPATDLDALVARHGRRGVVEKRRDLWLAGTTRIHLDEVVGLGSFLEFEVVEPPTMEAGRSALRSLLVGLDLEQADGLRLSYIDLIEAADDSRSTA